MRNRSPPRWTTTTTTFNEIQSSPREEKEFLLLPRGLLQPTYQPTYPSFPLPLSFLPACSSLEALSEFEQLGVLGSDRYLLQSLLVAPLVISLVPIILNSKLSLPLPSSTLVPAPSLSLSLSSRHDRGNIVKCSLSAIAQSQFEMLLQSKAVIATVAWRLLKGSRNGTLRGETVAILLQFRCLSGSDWNCTERNVVSSFFFFFFFFNTQRCEGYKNRCFKIRLELHSS